MLAYGKIVKFDVSCKCIYTYITMIRTINDGITYFVVTAWPLRILFETLATTLYINQTILLNDLAGPQSSSSVVESVLSDDSSSAFSTSNDPFGHK